MKHLIKIEATEHGALSTLHLGKDQQWCEAGQTVQVKNQPDTGWGLQSLYFMVGDDPEKIEIDMETMAFTMPNGEVTVGGTFKRFVIGDWTEGKGINSDVYVFIKGDNGEPMALPLATFVRLFTDDDFSEQSRNPVENRIVTAALRLKQALLVSGENIKTVNGNSLLGSGNISIGGTDASLESLGFQAFDASQDYLAGETVVHDGALYTFTADHTGAWSSSDVELTDLLKLLAEGGIDVLASDITPKSEAMQEFTQKFTMQTSGGDADIKSGASALLDIKGNLDASLNPFIADRFVSTSMNLVDPLEFVEIVGKRSYIFPVAAGHWGQYGTTQENNGYVIIGGNVDSVYFKATKPTGTSFGEACPYHTNDGIRYYLPPAQGWMVIVCNDTVDVPACHIAWSNYNDAVPGIFNNTVKNIEADVQWVHTWGLALVTGNGKTVFDEVQLGGKRYRRTDRAALASLAWTQETIVGDQSTTYVYTAYIAAMAVNPAWAALYPLEIEGNNVIIRSQTIDTVEALQAELAGEYIYFELATPASSNATATTDSQADDFGLTYFLNGGELATVPAFVTEGFYQGGKDQLFNAVTYQKILAEVIASALCNLDLRLSAIEGKVSGGFDYLKATNLEVTRQLVSPE